MLWRLALRENYGKQKKVIRTVRVGRRKKGWNGKAVVATQSSLQRTSKANFCGILATKMAKQAGVTRQTVQRLRVTNKNSNFFPNDASRRGHMVL